MTKLWIFMTIAAVPFMAAYRLGDKDKYQITQADENLTDDESFDEIETENEEWDFVEKGCDLNHPMDQSFQLYHGQSRFAVSLLHAMQQAAPKKNQFFSPHSTYRALLLAYFGAEGKTKESLERALHLGWAKNKSEVSNAYQKESKARAGRSFGDIQFNSVDKIYVTNQVELNTRITDLFTESVEKVDFSDAEQRREEINAFVEQVTQSHIKDLLAPGSISPATKLVLTNAAFFKGFWATKFDKKDTETKTFNGATKGGVEMMHVKGNFNYGVIDELKVAFLELPYSVEDATISMFVYLPIENTSTAVDGLLSKFSVKTIHEALTTGSVQEVDVKFPKISLDGSYFLASILEKMGVKNLFGTSADLSGFSTTAGLYFEDAIHKAKIEIDEDGSTAAAAVATFSRSLKFDEPKEPTKFHCDHPFVFMINDRVSTEVLFAGVYRGPN